MNRKLLISAFAALIWADAARADNCTVSPMNFNSHIANVEAEMTIKAGKGCGFGLNGIQGAINEAVIVQKPKVGLAGVQGLTPFYVAKPGYKGADEFSYAIIGTDQYGGLMRVTTKLKVTVVP
ncbi:hypothetical protein [Microvirga alba]|uniref:Secreted protein n=1 Tax=Microvirga alba TaxID=2791025 RepID=A0A931FMN4_9HYPH|nr:hypothetical protein [Microvirga alba]MBF9232745.1 hypothetical protein [Microvirga alba]